MREKFIRFMNGRNGMDELARAESWVVMILLVVSIFTRSAILDILAIGLMIHMYFRVFSRNVNKRYAENQKFLNVRYEWTVKAERRKKRFAQRKQYKFFKCPMCKQDVHGCSILCNLIGAKCTLLRRVHAAYKSIPRYTIRLVQACQKHYEKSHVIV